MESNTVITISREFGSGGREVGKKLSEKLGISFYDRDLISLAAEQSGMSREVFENVDETAQNPFFSNHAASPYIPTGRFSVLNDISINDRLFFIQSDVIRSLAQKESCIIVGRCADYILRENPNVINVFIFSDLQVRVARVAELYDLTEHEAKNITLKTDKRRASYYNYYSGKKWGRANSYHLSVDSGFTGIDNTVEAIGSYVGLMHK
ncbi:MAG: AAA family ATPase [Christensenellaceae bacterium]|jgi:cytidylate kinase